MEEGRETPAGGEVVHGVEDEDNNDDNNDMKTQRVHQGALIATVVYFT